MYIGTCARSGVRHRQTSLSVPPLESVGATRQVCWCHPWSLSSAPTSFPPYQGGIEGGSSPGVPRISLLVRALEFPTDKRVCRCYPPPILARSLTRLSEYLVGEVWTEGCLLPRRDSGANRPLPGLWLGASHSIRLRSNAAPGVVLQRRRSLSHRLRSVRPRRYLDGWAVRPWWRWCAPMIIDPTMTKWMPTTCREKSYISKQTHGPGDREKSRRYVTRCQPRTYVTRPPGSGSPGPTVRHRTNPPTWLRPLGAADPTGAQR